MRVLIVGKSSRLLTLVQNISDLQEVVYLSEPEQRNYDTFLLDDVDFPMLELAKQNFQNHKILYIFSARGGMNEEEEQRYAKTREVCLLNHISFITDVSDNGLVADIELILFPDRFHDDSSNPPSMALISCHRRAGRKTIADSIASALSQRTKSDIAIIDMNPYSLSENTESTMLHLYKEYDAAGLKPSRIKEIAVQRADGTYYIGGNPKMDMSRGYSPAKLEQMINIIQQAFHFTIFLISPYWDNNLTLVPIKNIQQKYLIATSKVEEMKEFYAAHQQMQFLFQLNLRQVPFIYNLDGVSGESKNDVAINLQSSSIFQLGLLPSGNKKGPVIKAADRLIESIITNNHLERIQRQDTGNKTSFRFLRRRAAL
ncbi:hypothetical protein LJR153_007304 [Paenibacillus sp. LjRoot153]|uniref:hypothetical protein n=1 Tax=Paenibacillus sp. LjRoot153 TaxID=3342270 RepID=UPI003ED047C9